MCINGDPRAERQLHRYDAIEDDRAHTVREPARIGLRDPGAIGNSIEIDSLVAQGRAHLIKISNGDAGGIKPWVTGHLLETRCKQFTVPRRVELQGVHALRHRAGLLVRAARPALVDQHDVTVAVDAPESPARRDKALQRGLSGAAGDEEQGICGLTSGRRRQYRDFQRDGCTVRFGRVFRNLIGTTLSRHARRRLLHGQVAWPEFQGGKVGRVGRANQGEEKASEFQGDFALWQSSAVMVPCAPYRVKRTGTSRTPPLQSGGRETYHSI